MTDMERRNFEDSFKNAFDGAEAAPSENVWTNIELELEKAEGGKIRRRLLFYKLLAAASVAFAMCVAGIGYYVVNNNDSTRTGVIATNESETTNRAVEPANGAAENLRDNNQSPVEATPSNVTAVTPGKELTAEVRATREHNDEDDNYHTIKGSATDRHIATHEPIAPVRATGANVHQDSGEDNASVVTGGDQLPVQAPYAGGQLLSARELPPLHHLKVPALESHIVKPDPGVLLLARLAEEEQRYAEMDKKENRNNQSEKLWTSLGFAAGGFSSVNYSVSSPPAGSNVGAFLANSSVADKQSKASGVAYSFGVNVGTRLSRRWVLQGGVNYLTQSSDYVATNVVGDNNLQSLRAESINELDKISQLPQVADISANKLAPTVPYSVNNNVRFFSVPVQAGYLLVNRKFGLQLNGGISTDLFLQNTITPEGGSLDKTTQGRGDDSPYRSVNFSGLMGTELSYKFGQRYRVALNPGLRYPINSVYKSDVGIKSTPITFDVGLRFRYIFH